MDKRWREANPERAHVLGGHGGDTFDQRMVDALLELAGIRNATSDTKSSDTSDRSSDSAAKPETTGPTGSKSDTETRSSTYSSDQSAQPFHAENDDVMIADREHNGETVDAEATHTTVVKSAKPAVVLVIDIDRYEAEIIGHGPIPMNESFLDPVRNDLYYYFKNGKGEVLKLGRAGRDPTPAQRLAVVVRDRHCQYPGCKVSGDRGEIHHLAEWVKDHGLTDVDVLGLFCPAHHHHIHIENLVAIRTANGNVSIIDRRSGALIARAKAING